MLQRAVRRRGENLSDSKHCYVHGVLAMDINHSLDNQIPFLPWFRRPSRCVIRHSPLATTGSQKMQEKAKSSKYGIIRDVINNISVRNEPGLGYLTLHVVLFKEILLNSAAEVKMKAAQSDQILRVHPNYSLKLSLLQRPYEIVC